MAQRHLVLMHPEGSVASPIHSHTLFGAVCWALATLGQDVAALLDGFDGGPRFAMSGAYPYMCGEGSQPLLLVPAPPLFIPPTVVASYPKASIAERVDAARKVQGAAYLSPAVTSRLRDGSWGPTKIFEEMMQGRVDVRSDMLFLTSEATGAMGRAEFPALWKRAIVQRNSVDRLAGASVDGLLFHQQELYVDRQRAGLWFGVWTEDDVWPALRAAFRLMEDTGLGAKRAVGKGHFRFEVASGLVWDGIFPPTNSKSRFLSLSHYIPADTAETSPVAYTLDAVRQKAENRYPQGSQRVYIAALRAFRPGGIFEAPKAHDSPYGRLLPLDTLEGRTVRFSGMTIPLWGAWEV